MDYKTRVREPNWACSCGFANNWAWRNSCWKCGLAIPKSKKKFSPQDAQGPTHRTMQTRID
eukprot:3072767-Prorocentrum_lima.AAC.1